MKIKKNNITKINILRIFLVISFTFVFYFISEIISIEVDNYKKTNQKAKNSQYVIEVLNYEFVNVFSNSEKNYQIENLPEGLAQLFNNPENKIIYNQKCDFYAKKNWDYKIIVTIIYNEKNEYFKKKDCYDEMKNLLKLKLDTWAKNLEIQNKLHIRLGVAQDISNLKKSMCYQSNTSVGFELDNSLLNNNYINNSILEDDMLKKILENSNRLIRLSQNSKEKILKDFDKKINFNNKIENLDLLDLNVINKLSDFNNCISNLRNIVKNLEKILFINYISRDVIDYEKIKITEIFGIKKDKEDNYINLLHMKIVFSIIGALLGLIIALKFPFKKFFFK